MGYATIAEKLAGRGTVVLDGAIGTEVLRRTDRWVRNGIELSPDVIHQIHADYIAAGADVITTDTFQIARHTFLNFFHDLEHMRQIGAPGLETRAAELARDAVNLAREARTGADADESVAIAGSISPLNHPYRPDLAPDDEDQARAEHAETAAGLADAGVDLILLETMNTLAEARAALRAAKDTGLPTWVSLVPNGHGETLGHDALDAAAQELEQLGADAVLVNCAPVEQIDAALATLSGSTSCPLGAYALIGRYAPPSWKMDFYPRFVDTDLTPSEEYAKRATGWTSAGARIVGGCCGTSPSHIRALRSVLGNGASS